MVRNTGFRLAGGRGRGPRLQPDRVVQRGRRSSGRSWRHPRGRKTEAGTLRRSLRQPEAGGWPSDSFLRTALIEKYQGPCFRFVKGRIIGNQLIADNPSRSEMVEISQCLCKKKIPLW